MTMNANQARTVDPVLSQVARGYKSPTHVGSVLFPRVDVTAQGGKIIEFGKEIFALLNARRAPGANVTQYGFSYSNSSFQLVQDALDAVVPREIQQDAMTVPKIDIGTRTSKRTMEQLSLILEFEQAELATDHNNYPATHSETVAGTDRWDDPNSDPMQQIEDAKEIVRKSSGVEPNRMVIPKPAFNALRFHPKIIDRFKYTTADSITADMLAAFLELDTLAVGKAASLSDNDPENGTLQDAWGNHAVLAYVPDTPEGMEEPSFGYTYTMLGHPFVEPPRWNGDRRSWIYGLTYDRVPLIVGGDAGFLISGVTE